MLMRLFCFSLAFISTGSEADCLDGCLQLQGINRHFSTSEYNYVERELSFKPCAMSWGCNITNRCSFTTENPEYRIMFDNELTSSYNNIFKLPLNWHDETSGITASVNKYHNNDSHFSYFYFSPILVFPEVKFYETDIYTSLNLHLVF